jgi:MOSC domain-containing protein YiiM
MKVVSVNVGLPQEVEWKGQRVSTGIFKKPVEGRVRVRTLNLEGDRQADLTVHGGWEKAVYTYPSKGYALWRKERPELDLPWSKFGENLTTEGLLDEEVNVGDWFRIGSAEFVVTEPRLPCYKLGIKMGRDEFVAEFLERGLLGFYLAVAKQGEIGPGDEIVALSRDPNGFKVTRTLTVLMLALVVVAVMAVTASMAFAKPGPGSSKCTGPPPIITRTAHKIS